MNVQAINNDYSNCSPNFSGHIRTYRLRTSAPKHPVGRRSNPKSESNKAHKRENVVTFGSIIAGVAQAIGGMVSALINPDSLDQTRLCGILLYSGLITAVVGITESDKIADFLKNKGILK